jgi:hypothetical protein
MAVFKRARHGTLLAMAFESLCVFDIQIHPSKELFLKNATALQKNQIDKSKTEAQPLDKKIFSPILSSI